MAALKYMQKVSAVLTRESSLVDGLQRSVIFSVQRE